MFANVSFWWPNRKFKQLYSLDVTVLSALLWSAKEKAVAMADYGKAQHITYAKHSVWSSSVRNRTQHPHKIRRGVLRRKTIFCI